MGAVKEITSHEEWKTIINSGKPIVVDFWATWCGPCRVISPVFEKFAEENGVATEFYKVDVDTQGEIAQEVGIKAMPTFVLYKNGELIDTVVGASAPNVKNLVEKAATLV